METLKRKQDARLGFRLSNEEKQRIEKAALISGQSLSDFALTALLKLSSDILDEHHHRRLSNRDRDRFLALLEADDEPTEAAKQAAEQYRQGHVEGSGYYR